MPTPEHAEQYQQEGYFIVEDAAEPDMLEPLLAATKRTKEKVRSGAVDRYTHWAQPGEPWAIRGLFAPEFEEPIFAEYLLSKPVMDYVEPFLGKELRLGGVLIFTNPHDADYGFGWHRDIGKDARDGTEEVEMAVLNRPMVSLKWHLALVDDECLQLVPGSQRRYRTPFERECLLQTRNANIPRQKVIRLRAGQTCFWNGNTIHRGCMKKDVERLTLAGSWRKQTENDKPEETDPRLRWMLEENVRGFLPNAMKPAYDRWRALQKEAE
jgi:hypothetical protein